MGRKRKSESASDNNPPKRPAIDPYTGEPRKRGRPRKYPPGEEPQPPPGPKRGRGRPRKDGTIKSPGSAPATPQGPKRPVGRPRKTPVKDEDADADTDETPSQPTESDAADADADAAEAKSTDDDSERTYWLMKAEPESRIEKGTDVKFSIDDLEAATEPEPWDGVRNAVARNHMRAMKKGDHAFFYHSNCKVPGIVGIMEIVQEHTPDESAFDPAHPYYDAKSNRNDPKWDVVHVEFRRKFDQMVTLNDLKAHAKPGQPLENLQVLKQSRLSVSSVTPAEWKYILGLAGETSK